MGKINDKLTTKKKSDSSALVTSFKPIHKSNAGCIILEKYQNDSFYVWASYLVNSLWKSIILVRIKLL